jgi:hypothetical protein
VSEHTEVAFASARLVRLPAQRRTQNSLVAGENALCLPPLPVDALMLAALGLLAKPLHHLPTVVTLRPLPSLTAAVDGDDRGADALVLAAVAVVLLTIEGRVRQHTVVADNQRRLRHRRAELGCVVGRSKADGGRREEMAPRLAGDGQLGPQPGVMLAAYAFEEISGRVPAFHAGGIDGSGRLGADQATLLCARGGLGEEQDELPLFSSRLAA